MNFMKRICRRIEVANVFDSYLKMVWLPLVFSLLKHFVKLIKIIMESNQPF